MNWLGATLETSPDLTVRVSLTSKKLQEARKTDMGILIKVVAKAKENQVEWKWEEWRERR